MSFSNCRKSVIKQSNNFLYINTGIAVERVPQVGHPWSRLILRQEFLKHQFDCKMKILNCCRCVIHVKLQQKSLLLCQKSTFLYCCRNTKIFDLKIWACNNFRAEVIYMEWCQTNNCNRPYLLNKCNGECIVNSFIQNIRKIIVSKNW